MEMILSDRPKRAPLPAILSLCSGHVVASSHTVCFFNDMCSDAKWIVVEDLKELKEGGCGEQVT